MVSIGKANRFAGVFGVRLGGIRRGRSGRDRPGTVWHAADRYGKVPSLGRIGRVAD
jgi:hypothetical protein